MAYKNEHIWIIGASSGIGRALAIELDKQGATLILSARREDELQALQQELAGEHHIKPLDVSERESLVKAANEIISELNTIQRIIFMAAIFRPSTIDANDISFDNDMVDVNLKGALNTISVALPILKQQPSGQIALCGSIAGYTGLPGGQPYCSTKAAIKSLCESLYAEVDEHIDVKLISPGFVRTRITDKNDFPMPLMMEPEKAAVLICKGLNRSAFEIHFPKLLTYAVKFLNMLPNRLRLWICRNYLATL